MNLEIIDIEATTDTTARLTIEYDNDFKSKISNILNKKNATKLEIESYVAHAIEDLLDELEH